LHQVVCLANFDVSAIYAIETIQAFSFVSAMPAPADPRWVALSWLGEPLLNFFLLHCLVTD